jgi:hypothetical protein
VSKGILEKAHRLTIAVPAGYQMIGCSIRILVYHAGLHIQEFV